MINVQWLGVYSVDDYQLYSLGYYSGVVFGEGIVYGEVYCIDVLMLVELDVLCIKGGEYVCYLIQMFYGSVWMYVY